MASPPSPPLVVPIVVAPVEDPVEAPPVVVFPIEAGFLLPLIGLVETLSVPGTSASASSLASPRSRALLLAVVERAQ